MEFDTPPGMPGPFVSKGEGTVTSPPPPAKPAPDAHGINDDPMAAEQLIHAANLKDA